MQTIPRLNRRRRWLAVGLVAAAYLVLSLRHVPEGGAVAVRDSPFLKTTPKILPPGWHLAPPGILHVYRYPAGAVSRTLLLDAAHGTRLETRDGRSLGAEVEIRLRILPEHVLEVHRTVGPAFASSWLIPQVVEAAREVASRNTLEEITGPNRPRLARALMGALRPGLEEEGFRLESLELWRAGEGDLPPNVDRADLQGDPAARVLFIGIDSADWAVIDPLRERGLLPNLQALVDGGTRARLRTISPVLSPVVWTTIATGKMPQKHGIVDFLAVDARSGQRVPVTSNLRRTRAVWNILGDAGVDVGIVAWWATWPAEKVEGFLVTERVSYQLFGMGKQVDEDAEGKVYPPDLYPAVEQLRVRPSSITAQEVGRFLDLPRDGWESLPLEERERVEEFRTVLAATRTYHEVAGKLFRERPTPFRAVYFEGLDTTSHLFMQYRPPRLPMVTEEQVARYGDAVDRFLVYQDEILGDILRDFGGDGVHVIIASDHGFRTDANRPLEDARIGGGKAAEWHRKFGVLLLHGPAFRRGVEIPEASVIDVVPTLLALYGLPKADDMDGRVLAEAFRDGFLEAQPTVSLRTYDDPETGEGERAPIASGVDGAMVERLQALGYISQAGSNSHNNRGVLHLNRGELDEAIEAFRAALEEEPQFLVARINMGRAYMLKGNAEEALAVFQDVLRRDPDAQDVENFVGNIHMERGDFRQAEEHFRRAVTIEPNNADARNSLGILYERQGRLDEAMEEYRRVVEVDPEYGEGFNNLGNVLKRLGRGDEAEAMYRRAMEADPDFVGSYNNLALLMQERGDIAQAEEWYRKAVERAPDHPQVRLNLGSLYYAQGKLEEAREEFARAIELDPGYAEAHNNLGAVYGALQQPERELEELRRAVEINPDYADARHNLGLAFLRAGQDQRGIDELRRAVQIEPEYLSALANLGIALARRAREAEAIPYLERVVALNPRLPAVRNTLAGAYLAVGRRRDAVAQFEASLAVAPDQPQIRQRLEELGAEGR